MSESTAPPDAGQSMATGAARPFESYTVADHARVAMAHTAWSTLEAAYRAIVPEVSRPDGEQPTVLLEAASWVQGYAENLLRDAVIASHERGMSWAQIGRGLGITKQAAHERFAGDVTAFRQRLAQDLDAKARDSAASTTRDTARHASEVDAWRAALGTVGFYTDPGKPGELLAQLSDPRDDLTTLTRDELLPRLEAEQEYWARKEKRGLSAADQQARKEFSDLVFAVINPAGLADSMAETTAWLKGERPTDSGYWKAKPGHDQL